MHNLKLFFNILFSKLINKLNERIIRGMITQMKVSSTTCWVLSVNVAVTIT